MNDIFNLRRFGKYLASDAGNCVANYGLSMAIISLMGLIIYVGTVMMGLIFNGEWGGPDSNFRIFTFFTALVVMMFTMPVKCYGRITEKRFGTQWLMVPASSFEKFLSMVIMSVIAVPAVTCTVYFAVDAILCALDGTCGQSIITSFKSLLDSFTAISIASESDMEIYPNLASFVMQVSNPWLYVDDIMGMFLITLLGAVIFKKGKSAKTILSYFAIVIVLGLMFTPFAKAFFNEFAAMSFNLNSTEELNQLFGKEIFTHAALLDTLNDTVVNIALLVAIYFRIKTLKH